MVLSKIEHHGVEQSPRVPCFAATVAEWEEKAEPYFQGESGGGVMRSCYDMHGQSVFLEVYLPRNPFKKSWSRMIAADFMLKENSSVMELAKIHGAYWEEGYYMDDGYGWPVFPGEDAGEKCFAFIMEWLQSNSRKVAE